MLTAFAVWIGLIAINQSIRPEWAPKNKGQEHRPYPAGLAFGLTVGLVILINWSH